MTGSSAALVRAAQPRPATWVDARLLTYVALADLVFVTGVLVPYLTRADQPTAGGPEWLGWPALASLFLLPMVAVGAGAAAGSRLGAAGRRRWLALATLALAVAGLAAYISPVGIAAVRWFLD